MLLLLNIFHCDSLIIIFYFNFTIDLNEVDLLKYEVMIFYTVVY